MQWWQLKGGKITKHNECVTNEKISFIDAYDPKQKHIWYVKDSIYIDLINSSCLFELKRVILQWIFRLFYNEYLD